MDPIVCKGDPTTLPRKPFQLGEFQSRFVVSFPSARLSVRVYQDDNGTWRVYRYYDYISDPTDLPSNIVYVPSTPLELLVLVGIGMEELEAFAKDIRPGKERKLEKE